MQPFSPLAQTPTQDSQSTQKMPLPGGGEKTKCATEDSVYYEKDEKMLKELDYYHGFLPREDLQFLCKKDGDFIIRTSEVDCPPTKVVSAEPLKLRRELVLSLYADLDSEGAAHTPVNPTAEAPTTPPIPPTPNASKRYKMRNMLIKKTPQNKYSLEPEKYFNTPKELIAYYHNNYGVVSKARFILRNGIKLQSWELLHKDIEVSKDRLLGEGAYGEVRAGILKKAGEKHREVAIKITKGSSQAKDQDLCKSKIKEMMREARMMRYLSHPNIVRFYGVAVDEQPLYIVLELIKGGALNSYLQKNKCSIEEKMSMALGAARGVDYLHKAGIIHRDLAARNCLYDKDEKCVKIGDFGLSRKAAMYTIKVAVKLPIKWLAPETISNYFFTQKTDVWSFGVMVFEIFANGMEPWEGVTNTEVKRLVAGGTYLSLKGKGMPDHVKDFITTRVFVKEPTNRCEVSQFVRLFEGAKPEPSVKEKDAGEQNTLTVAPAVEEKAPEDVKKEAKSKAHSKVKGTKENKSKQEQSKLKATNTATEK